MESPYPYGAHTRGCHPWSRGEDWVYFPQNLREKTHRMLTSVLRATVFLEKLVIFIKQGFFLKGTYGPSSASFIFKEHSFYFFFLIVRPPSPSPVGHVAFLARSFFFKKISRNDSITRLLASRCVAGNKREARLIPPLSESWNFLLRALK